MRLGGGAHPTPIYNTGWIEALTKGLCLPLSLTHLLHHRTPGLRAPSPHPHLMALALCPPLSLGSASLCLKEVGNCLWIKALLEGC